MRKIILYIAMSLDGKIAKPNGDVSWLEEIPVPDNEDYGYGALIERIDTTLMGNKTFKQIQQFEGEFPYKGLKNFIFTQNSEQMNSDDVEYVSGDVVTFIKELKTQPGKDIWLIGGGQINALLLNHHLIDEIIAFMMPVVLGTGIPMFHSLAEQSFLKHTESISYPNGVVLLRYVLNE